MVSSCSTWPCFTFTRQAATGQPHSLTTFHSLIDTQIISRLWNLSIIMNSVWCVILKSNVSRILTGIKKTVAYWTGNGVATLKKYFPCSLLDTAILKHGNQSTSNYSTIYLDVIFQFAKHRMALRGTVSNCEGREENRRFMLEHLINKWRNQIKFKAGVIRLKGEKCSAASRTRPHTL